MGGWEDARNSMAAGGAVHMMVGLCGRWMGIGCNQDGFGVTCQSMFCRAQAQGGESMRCGW